MFWPFFFLVRVSVLYFKVFFATVLYFKLTDACCLSSERNLKDVVVFFTHTRRCKTLGHQGINFLS